MDISPVVPQSQVKVEIEEARPSLLATSSWVLYDFANTIFSLNVVTSYFPLFITSLGYNDIVYAAPQSLAQLIIAFICPLIGALSDKGGGRRMPWLVATTIGCVALTVTMGLIGGSLIWFTVAAYVLANVFYQISLQFYDSLLPSVSTTETWGTISGWGVGIGYAGALLGGILVGTVIPIGKGEEQSAFIPTALLFLLFALPCFLFVKERKVRLTAQGKVEAEESAASAPLAGNLNSGLVDMVKTEEVNDYGFNWPSFKRSLSQTWRTLQETRKYPGLFTFLVANFFYTDALNTVIIAMSVYSVNVIGFEKPISALAPAIIAAVIGSIIFGFVLDRVGSKTSITISLILWMITLVGAIFITDKTIFQFGVATLAGVALGSTWVGARTMMIELSPPEHLGEFMGIYSLTGKFAAVLGPLLWGGTLLILAEQSWRYQVAISTLLLLIVIGFVIHQRTPDVRRTKAGVTRLKIKDEGCRGEAMIYAPPFCILSLSTFHFSLSTFPSHLL